MQTTRTQRISRTAVRALLVGALAFAACDDPSGIDEVTKTELDLVAVNGRPLPAIGVEGTCWNPLLFFFVWPDSILVDGGRLTMEDGRYELYYTWRGATDACTLTHSHWHRISGGTYSFAGDVVLFSEGEEPDHFPTSYRKSSPGRPTGVSEGSDIVVRWGALTLRYAPRR